MRKRSVLLWGSLAACLAVAIARGGDGKKEISFEGDVFPVIKRVCLPCHAEDQFNPSELSMDTYALLMAGGKHGVPVVAGKPKESLLLKKLTGNPPFGDPMPLDPKRKKGEPQRKRLSDQEIQILQQWIAEGAKNN